MSTKTKMWAAVLGLTIALPGLALAQAASQAPAQKKTAAEQKADIDKMIELLRKDVQAQKADIIGKTMALDATQAAAFWPVYKAYEAEMRSAGDARLAVIQDLAEHFETLNDAKAKALLDRSIAVEQQKLAVMTKYKDEFLKVLPAKVVARFFQVDSRLNNLIALEVSSQIPLVY